MLQSLRLSREQTTDQWSSTQVEDQASTTGDKEDQHEFANMDQEWDDEEDGQRERKPHWNDTAIDLHSNTSLSHAEPHNYWTRMTNRSPTPGTSHRLHNNTPSCQT